MSSYEDARRRLLLAVGRTMTLQRLGGPSVDVLGYPRNYQPDELTGGIQQGDRRVEILTAEINAAGWPGPPRNGDRLVIDNRTATLQAAFPVDVAGRRIGYSLWVRGG